MANLTKIQVAEIIKNRPAGVNPEDVIAGLQAKGHTLEGLQAAAPVSKPSDAFPMPNLGTANSSAQTGQGESVVGQFAQAAIKPIVRIAGSFAPAVDALMGKSQEEISQRNVEGRDFGILGDKIKPYGWQASAVSQGEMGVGEAATRMAFDIAGSQAEILSYAVAPLKLSGPGTEGFKNLLKNTAGVSSMTAAAGAGQSIGDGDSAGKALAIGAGSYIASTASFGLMRFAGNLFSNYGARLVQDDAVNKLSQNINDDLTNVIKTNPDLLKPNYAQDPKLTQSYLISEKGRVFSNQFEKDMTAVRNQSIDNLLPKVNDPNAQVHDFYNEMGRGFSNEFKEKTGTLYDSVKANPSKTKDLTVTKEVVTKYKQEYGVNTDDLKNRPVTAAEIAALQAKGEQGVKINDFIAYVDEKTAGGASVKDVLDIMNDSFYYSGGMSKAELVAMRDITDALRTDVRAGLPKDVIKEWDAAHNAWQQSVTLYSNPVLQNARNSGFSDGIVDAVMTLKPSPERDFLMDTLAKNKKSADLLINTVLRRAKQMSNQDANKYISDFRKATTNFEGGDSMFTAEQDLMLESFEQFTKQDLGSAIHDMQKGLGLTDETYVKMVEGLEKISIYDELKKGSFNDISKNFNKMVIAEPEQLGKFLGDFDEQERQVFGMMLVRDLVEKRNIQLMPDPANPGTMKIGDNFMKTYADMYETITRAQMQSGSDTLHGMFTLDEVNLLKQGFEDLNKLNVLKEAPEAKKQHLNQILNGVTAILYAKLGYVTGATRSGMRAFSNVGTLDPNLPTQKQVAEIITQMQVRGEITPEDSIPDIFEKLNARLVTPTAGNLPNNVDETNE